MEETETDGTLADATETRKRASRRLDARSGSGSDGDLFAVQQFQEFERESGSGFERPKLV